jgi:hypothetical protein
MNALNPTIKLSRAEHVMRVSDKTGFDPQRDSASMELTGIDDVTCTAFSHARVQATHGARKTDPDGTMARELSMGRVYLREPDRFSYPRILEYLSERPAMTFLGWCVNFGVLSPAHVFSALASHEGNVDRHDMLEMLSVLGDFYERTAKH